MTEESQERVVFTVPEGVEQVRVDKVVADHFDNLSRAHLENAFKSEHVWVDDVVIPKRHRVSAGQSIEIIPPELEVATIGPVDIPVDVIYEDKDIVAINKAAGMVVHPGNGTGDDTLTHAMLHHTQGKLSRLGGKLRPGVVHRLDKDTSGVIVYAKTDAAYLQLIRMFAEREIDKQYLAMVNGHPRLLSGVIKASIGRHRMTRTKMAVDTAAGRDAHTEWEVEETIGAHYALLRCWIYTGRTHQIRVHLQHIGHSILGDETYGYRPRVGAPVVKRVLLHATELAFKHPVTQEPLCLKAPMPKDFIEYRKLLQEADA